MLELVLDGAGAAEWEAFEPAVRALDSDEVSRELARWARKP
jgi:hypothetical protein